MLPLEGIRVIDNTIVWGGPYGVKQLADFGAEVIKVESARYFDMTRGQADPPPGSGMYADGDPGAKPWNRAGYYNCLNNNKKSLCIDLTKPEGVEIYKKLAAVSDVVIDNYRAMVMERFGLGYEALKAVNPRIIVLSMPSNGSTGPEREYGAFGATLENTTGMSWLSGYGPDEDPYRGGINYPDPVGGLNAAAAILVALRYRRRTGKGQFIDLSQREGAASLLGEYILDFSLNGRIASRTGNKHDYMAPHGCYPCAGDDDWITIAVANDEQWKSFVKVIGNPEWAQDQRFDTVLGRYQNQEEINDRIMEYTLSQDHRELMHMLQKAGVPAGAVHNNIEVLDDPHLNERGLFEFVTHPEAGTHRYYGVTAKLSETPGGIRTPSPCLGEHNDYVLRDVLGLSEEKIRELADKGVTTNDPRAPGVVRR